MVRRGRPPKIGRDEIVVATLGVMTERGIAGLTTREIASRVGISEGSIFYHFGDRKGLIKAVFDEALRPLWQFRAVPPGPPATADELREGLHRFVVGVAEFLESGLDVMMAAQADVSVRNETFAVMLENDYGPQRGIDALTRYISSAQASGVVAGSVDPQAVAQILIASTFLPAAQPRIVGHTRGLVAPERILDSVMALLVPPPSSTADAAADDQRRSMSTPVARSPHSTATTSS